MEPSADKSLRHEDTFIILKYVKILVLLLSFINMNPVVALNSVLNCVLHGGGNLLAPGLLQVSVSDSKQ
jgi:hypothetical protein